jgi:hypothetical protein
MAGTQPLAARSPQHGVELLDQAFNEGNVDRVPGFFGEWKMLIDNPLGPLVLDA